MLWAVSETKMEQIACETEIVSSLREVKQLVISGCSDYWNLEDELVVHSAVILKGE